MHIALAITLALSFLVALRKAQDHIGDAGNAWALETGEEIKLQVLNYNKL